ncbi:MAG: hypothetical protein LWX07_10765 [Bacteroidetes bacterium]|nr:hypothetical protein [Bacteroidota bacterium]
MFGKSSFRILILISFFLTVSVTILSFNGCEGDNGITSHDHVISGRVSGIFDYPYQGVKVTAGNKSAVTDGNGYFYFSGLDFSGSITVLDTINNKCLYVPQRIFVPEATYAFRYLANTDASGFVEIKISNPDSLGNYQMKTLFSDYQAKNYYDEVNSGTRNISFPVPPGVSYAGNIIMLLYTVDSQNHIVLFNKYYVKDNVSVAAGDIINLHPHMSDFQVVPRNNVYHIELNPLPQHTVQMRYFTLFFGHETTINYSSFVSFDNFNGNSLDIVCPSLPYPFCLPMAGLYTADNNTYSRVLLPASMYSVMEAPPLPVLVSPADNANIDLNTEFVFNNGLNSVSNMYYKLYIADTVNVPNRERKSYEIYLDKERFNISELENAGLGSMKGRTFFWNVEVFKEASLDDELINKNMKICSSAGITRSFHVNP